MQQSMHAVIYSMVSCLLSIVIEIIISISLLVDIQFEFVFVTVYVYVHTCRMSFNGMLVVLNE